MAAFYLVRSFRRQSIDVRSVLITFNIAYTLSKGIPESRADSIPKIIKRRGKIIVPDVDNAVPDIRNITLSGRRLYYRLNIYPKIAQDKNNNYQNHNPFNHGIIVS